MAMTTPRAERPNRPRPRFRTLEVRRVAQLTPRMVRLTVGGPELDGFDQPAPTQHVKLIIPHPGQDRPVLPDPSLPKGVHGDGPRPLMRTYTIRRIDPGRQEMDIDVSLHGEGEVSEWARHAREGAVIALAGPGGRPHHPNPDVDWYVLAGDESALPAMGTLIEALPAEMPVKVYAEVPDENEHLDWGRVNLEVSWLDRGASGQPTGALLEKALLGGAKPGGDGRVWIACEAGIMRRIRKHLLDGWGLDPTQMVTRGYWKEGEVNYRDGDYGED
jgi:NADPH-dependent ferric siderophore reductase